MDSFRSSPCDLQLGSGLISPHLHFVLWLQSSGTPAPLACLIDSVLLITLFNFLLFLILHHAASSKHVVPLTTCANTNRPVFVASLICGQTQANFASHLQLLQHDDGSTLRSDNSVLTYYHLNFIMWFFFPTSFFSTYVLDFHFIFMWNFNHQNLRSPTL